MSRVAVIGIGTIGSAINERLRSDFEVVAIGRQDDLAAVTSADVAIVAVKPQSFTELASGLAPFIGQQLVISVMAGVLMETLQTRLGTDQVVRTMPNLTLRVGQSLTGWYADDSVTTTKTVEAILGHWGDAVKLEQEEQFHAFTALAASSPAYFYKLARLLEQNALDQGFTVEQARLIGIQSLRGAAIAIRGNEQPEQLVTQVASKGGTTEAALSVFQQQGFASTITQAIDAAMERSRLLGA